ncbi:MAG: hypothetical protein Q9201_007487 [Fulgogasparrea decipioides]
MTSEGTSKSIGGGAIQDLSKVPNGSQLIYRRILALQRDGITDREALAEMHEKHEYATLDFVRLVDLWLFIRKSKVPPSS